MYRDTFCCKYLHQLHEYVDNFVHILLLRKNYLFFNVNGVLCYFSWNVILQGKQRVRGKNIDSTKVETRVRIQQFFIDALKKFHIGIWLFMLIEDVMEVLTLLLPQDFIHQFVFIWGREQCLMTPG